MIDNPFLSAFRFINKLNDVNLSPLDHDIPLEYKYKIREYALGLKQHIAQYNKAPHIDPLFTVRILGHPDIEYYHFQTPEIIWRENMNSVVSAFWYSCFSELKDMKSNYRKGLIDTFSKSITILLNHELKLATMYPERYKGEDNIRRYIIRRSPDVKSKHIPFQENFLHLGFDTDRIKKIYQKLLQTNEPMKENKVKETSFHALYDLILTLPNDPETWNKLSLPSKDAISALHNMTNWPVNELFPVLDLIRILVLFSHKTEGFDYIIKDLNLKLYLLVSINGGEVLNYQTKLTALQFYLNLFMNKSWVQLLNDEQHHIINFLNKIVDSINGPIDEKNMNLLINVSRILVNFSKMWAGGNFGDLEAHCKAVPITFKLIKSLLSYRDKPNLVYSTLVALGTIIQSDACIETTGFVCVYEDDIIAALKSISMGITKGSEENLKVLDCVQYILELLRTQHELAAL
eukprot:TRINITY_DN317_c1_g1_i3.p1 TRINITY_DN317_c1_g1~~TRINITY_DN317_c1_g1_i3.p1  ORF type:complete len:461 (-),score=98.36 TRINITY_DN317_c1_g1_i3:395-1777(-)